MRKILPAIIFVFFFFISINTAKAATKSISIIRTDCSLKSIPTARCYNSLSAWESGEHRDLVASNEIAVAQIEGPWTKPDTTSVKLTGWVTDKTHYIKIYTAPDARHRGVWNNTKYRLVISRPGSAIYFPANGPLFITIDGLQIWNNYSGNSYIGAIDLASTDNTEINISNNILRGPDTNSNKTGLSGIQ
ncbi:MAG TPA: hypothetical protein ENJ75_02075, partial [Candidatus Kaiserbacteria bacterium]|nr:hypothetical protein [Candidatus Kaiserbacteria bacterium]